MVGEETMSTEVVAWSREEERAFENAIAMHWTGDTKELWEKIASVVPTKSVDEAKQHYQLLVEDVCAIEAGQVPIPDYIGEELTASTKGLHGLPGASGSDKSLSSGHGSGFSGFVNDMTRHAGRGASRSDQERRKGNPWTEEEHRSISRNLVVSRTPTQVASHAQKYFIRLSSMNRDRRRSSIHDITSVSNGNVSTPQAPITGQNNQNSTVTAGGLSVKHRSHSHIRGLTMSGASVGHPVGAPGRIASALGTPVMLPPGCPPPLPYVIPMVYPMAPPPPTMHQ